MDVDALAQEIRRVDGNHSLGAGALAEALMPFLLSMSGPPPFSTRYFKRKFEESEQQRIPLTNMLILCGEREVRDIESLPDKLRALIDGLIDQRRRAEALTAEVAALKRDAERYRFLKLTRAFRNPEASDDSVGYYGFRSTPLLVGMTLDAAIDAAIGQTVAMVPVPGEEGK